MDAGDSTDFDALRAAARAARAHAYAPYSGFTVGAAIRSSDGTVFTGANVENASYSLTICAERAAVAAAVSAGHTELREVAIDVEGPNGAPCGACRQVLAEFGVTRVSFAAAGGTSELPLAELLPHAFEPSDLVDD